jgi:hypothetical protein
MNAILFILGLSWLSSSAVAYDCSSIRPFVPGGQLTAKVSVSKFSWNNGQPDYQDVCSVSKSVRWFDVRGREEDAYYCLKPLPAEVATCDTELDGDPAQVEVITASWVREWQPTPVREYRFHAYVVKKSDPGFYLDVFSRNLSGNLDPENIVIEGSLKTGPSNPKDGYWVRVEFQNENRIPGRH